jgi:hypothetical protein
LSNERELPGFLADTGYDGTETVDLGAGCWAKVKRCLDRGELAEAEHALTQATVDMDGNGQLAPDVSTYRTLMVTHSIVEWNLTDPMEWSGRWHRSPRRLPASGGCPALPPRGSGAA